MTARRPRTALALLATVVVLAGCTSSSHSGSSGTPAGETSPLPSATTPAGLTAVVHTDHGPSGVAVTADGLYVANHRGGTVQRIDPSTNRVTGTLEVGGELNLGDDPTWACTNVDSVVHHLDLVNLRTIGATPGDCDGGSLSVVGRQLWSLPYGGTRLLVFDRTTGRLLRRGVMKDSGGPAVVVGGRVVLGGGATAPTYTLAGRPAGVLPVDLRWLLPPIAGALYRVPLDGRIIQLDPATLRPIRTIAAPPHHDDWNNALTGDGHGHLWYRPDYTHVYTVDITTGTVRLLATLPWEEVPTGLQYAFGSLWITNFDQDTVWRLDPTV